MTRTRITLAAALAASLASLAPQPAEAWMSANRWGGSTAHSWGATTHDNRWGGSTTHVYGEGTSHTGTYGNSYYRPPGTYGAYHPYYPPVYHPPVVVNSYAPGCYGCGAAVGAAAASAATSSTAASSYSAGYAAGAATATAYAMGSSVTALPPGSVSVNRGGTTYYINGNTWFLPTFGAGGVYYRVVPPP